MTSTETTTRIGIAASLASAQPIWSAAKVQPIAEAASLSSAAPFQSGDTVCGAAVNFSSKSCVVTVGGIEDGSTTDALLFSGYVVRWTRPAQAASAT
jgi:hypothetical protein